jgi:adhesin transport system membrane fusion protein
MIFRFLAGAMADAAVHHAQGAVNPFRRKLVNRAGPRTKPVTYVAPQAFVEPEQAKPTRSRAAPSVVSRALKAATAGKDAVIRAVEQAQEPKQPTTEQQVQAVPKAAAPSVPLRHKELVASPTSATSREAAQSANSLSIEGQMDSRLGGSSRLIWLTGGSVIVFLAWASFAWVDEIVRADGEMISSSRPQIIQNLEGGILAELMVAEGDEVQPGDVLARLHGTEFQTNVDDLREQVAALEIRRLRLMAEMEGLFDVIVPGHLSQTYLEVVESERALLNARQLDYVSRTDGARAVLDEARKEKELLERLLERKIVSLIEVTRARKAFSDAQAKYNEIVSQAELERASAFSETLQELTSLRQTLKIGQDQLQRTTLVSPLRGIVNKLPITTIGGVVRPGEEIAQIIPLGDELLVEARVKPKDIANVRPGQSANVKLSAYDYTIYGTLPATVHFISADTFKDERKPDGDAHYKVSLKLDTRALTARQNAIVKRPGMQAQVELHTGEKTVLQYLMKPLYKSREALREP